MAQPTTLNEPLIPSLIVSPTPYCFSVLLACVLPLTIFLLANQKASSRSNIISAAAIKELAATWSCIRLLLLISWIILLLLAGLLSHMFEIMTGLRGTKERQNRLEQRMRDLEAQAKENDKVVEEMQTSVRLLDMEFERARREWRDQVERRRRRAA